MSSEFDDVDRPSTVEIELRIVGDEVEPRSISERLGIASTRGFGKGDPSPSGREGRSRPWGLWAYGTSGVEAEEVAQRLLEALEPRAPDIGALAREVNGTVSLAIAWEPAGGQGGFTVGSATLARLCALAKRVDFYFA